MIGHTVVIKEQRGTYYAEVETLNGINIASGNSPREAFQNWYKNNKGFYPHRFHLTFNGMNHIISVPEFLEQYPLGI